MREFGMNIWWSAILATLANLLELNFGGSHGQNSNFRTVFAIFGVIFHGLIKQKYMARHVTKSLVLEQNAYPPVFVNEPLTTLKMGCAKLKISNKNTNFHLTLRKFELSWRLKIRLMETIVRACIWYVHESRAWELLLVNFRIYQEICTTGMTLWPCLLRSWGCFY